MEGQPENSRHRGIYLAITGAVELSGMLSLMQNNFLFKKFIENISWYSVLKVADAQ